MTTDCNESGMAGLGAAPGSADWLWGDIVGADISERTVTVQLRDGELPTVEVHWQRGVSLLRNRKSRRE